MNAPSTADLDLEKRVSGRLLDVLIRAGLVFTMAVLCYRIFSPFLALMAWALILAVTLYPAHQKLARKMGGRQGLAATTLVLGGIAVAYEGLQRFYKDHKKPGLIDGLTPEQRFFMSWGTIWRTKYRDEALRTQVLTDPHSPGMYRANGPLSNFEPFYKAYDVKEGDKMFRPDSARVKIW